jgi:hypothetical protein
MPYYTIPNFVDAAGTGRPALSPGYQHLEFNVDLDSDDINDGDGLPQGDYLQLATLPTNTRLIDCSIAAVTAVTNGGDLDVGISNGQGAGVGADDDGLIAAFDGTTAGNNAAGTGAKLANNLDNASITNSVVVATANVLTLTPATASANVKGKLRIGVVVMLPVG